MILNKKDFFKLAVKLAFPIMIQNLISTLVNAADTVMLGYVSQTAMSASSPGQSIYLCTVLPVLRACNGHLCFVRPVLG